MLETPKQLRYPLESVKSHIVAEMIEKSGGVLEISIIGLILFLNPFLATVIPLSALFAINIGIMVLIFIVGYAVSYRFVRVVQEDFLYGTRKLREAKDQGYCEAFDFKVLIKRHVQGKTNALGASVLEGLTFGMVPIILAIGTHSTVLFILSIVFGCIIGTVRLLKIYHADAARGRALVEQELKRQLKEGFIELFNETTEQWERVAIEQDFISQLERIGLAFSEKDRQLVNNILHQSRSPLPNPPRRTTGSFIGNTVRTIAASYGFFEGILVHGLSIFVLLWVLSEIFNISIMTVVSTNPWLIPLGVLVFLLLSIGEMPLQHYDAIYMINNMESSHHLTEASLKPAKAVIRWYDSFSRIIANFLAALVAPLFWLGSKLLGKKADRVTSFNKSRLWIVQISKVLGNAIMMGVLSLKLSVIFFALNDSPTLLSNLGHIVSTSTFWNMGGVSLVVIGMLALLIYQLLFPLICPQYQKQHKMESLALAVLIGIIGNIGFILLAGTISAPIGLMAMTFIIALLINELPIASLFHSLATKEEIASHDQEYHIMIAWTKRLLSAGTLVGVMMAVCCDVNTAHLSLGLLITLTVLFAILGGKQGWEQMKGRAIDYYSYGFSLPLTQPALHAWLSTFQAQGMNQAMCIQEMKMIHAFSDQFKLFNPNAFTNMMTYPTTNNNRHVIDVMMSESEQPTQTQQGFDPSTPVGRLSATV